MIATTSTAEKAERLRELGAAEVINYSETPNWDEKAHELTDGRGVDCVVEIGGPGTIAKSLKALAVSGHVSLIGANGVTVTWHATPVGTCAALIGRPIDECPSCLPDGCCQLCGMANGPGVQGCTLPKPVCQNGPCPVKSAPKIK